MAAFTAGNIVVYRVGAGAAALSSAATQVFLDEYTTAGVLVQSIPLPTATSGMQDALTASGTATSEGLISDSANGRELLLTGYDATVGTASVNSTMAAADPRVVGIVAANGMVDTSTVLTNFGTANNIRSAASVDGSALYVGCATGAAYTTPDSTAVPSTLDTINTRQIEIFGGQVYYSTGSGTAGIYSLGTGLPTSGTQTATLLPGTNSNGTSPYAFYLADLSSSVAGYDTLYVADSMKGIEKFALVGGTWTSLGQIAFSGVTGLTASVSGSTVTLYATSPGAIDKLVDTGGYDAALTGTLSTIATATANEAFRGVAFAPTNPPPVLTSVSPAEGATGVAAGANVVLTFNESVQAGSGAITVTDSAGDTRTISVTDGSQVSFNGATVTINPMADLKASDTYHVTFGSGVITDPSGAAYGGVPANTIDFTTAAAADTTPPTLASASPAEGATNVAAGANLVLTFSEAVKAGTGAITVTDSAGDTRTIDVTDASQASFNGAVLTINPTADLKGTDTYHVTFGAGVVTDLAGNAYAGLGSGVVDFTTADTTAPVLASTTPTENATDVAIGANLMLTFSKAVQAGAGSIVLHPTTGTGADITIPVGDTTQVSFSGATLTLNPTADLRPGVTYAVEIAAGVVQDANGNAYAGGAGTTSPNDALDFTTSSTIPAGAFATPFTISDAGTFTLLSGTTRTQTAGVAVKAVVATGATTIDLEGTLNDTAAKAVALAATLSGGGQITVGANGAAQSLNADTIQALAPNATVSLTNQGQIISETSTTTVMAGGPSPGTGYALNFSAVVGAAGAAAGDFTSGGTITNGSKSNISALIRSDSGDAIRLGSHETLVNYGTITADGPVNDNSTNNSFNSTSTATPYDISRGVRINQSGATSDDIENHGAISGSQHGVDVGQANVTGVLVNNYAGATIIGHNGSGVGADTTGAAANTVTVNNYGTIRGEYAPTYDRAGLATTDGDGDGVDIDGAGTVFNAAGALIAGSGANGVLDGQGAGGFDSNGRANKSEGVSIGGGSIDNAGTISGADYGVSVNNDSNTDNTRSGVAAVSITNEVGGAITGQAGYAIRIETKEGSAATDNDTIVNHGTITGNGVIPDPTSIVTREDGAPDPGVNGTLDGVTYTSSANAGNARFISGDGSAIQTGEGADVLSNYGAIVGDTGRAINLEGGDDTLNLFTGSSITGRIDGGAGSDTLNLLAAVGASAGTLANVIDFESLHVQSGAWTLADAQAYVSGVTIDAGATLQLGSGGAAGALTGAIADAGVLAFDRSDVVTETQAISGAGVISQIGAGTTTFSVAESFTGAVQVAAGVLDVAAAGAVGSGQISFATASATLKVEAAALQSGAFANVIGGAVAGDVIDLAGIGAATSATVSGSTLTVSGGSQTATLHLDPTASYSGLAFTPTSDGAGGTKLTVQSAAPPATVLQPGDIAVIGYGASAYNATTNPDGKGVAAVLLTSITGGTVIHFTDDGWIAASGTFRTGEGDLVYTAPAGGAAAGTVITFLNQTGNFNLSTSGDQVTIFQGSLSAPTNDFALNFNSAGYTDATNSNTTAAPTGLTQGATAITFNGMLNGAYTGPTTGTKAQLLADIDSAANWTFGSSTTPTFQTTAFSVAGTAPDTTPPTLASSSPADHATGVAPTSNVGLMFSEVVKAGAGSIVLHPDSGADVTIAAADAGQVMISGANVTINPTADLAASTHYEVLIGSTAFTDTSNNAFAGTTGDALDFTTGAAAAPSLSIAGVSMAEGNSGQTPFAFTVTRTGDTSGVSTVHYATADGTATVADGDYAATSGDLSFAAGQTTATITVQVNGDTKVEPNETFTLALSSPSAGTNVSTATATGTIVNDDVTITPIYTIQGAGHVSPYVGQSVSTRGIVTLVDTNNHGFWLQDPTGDGDVNTSDAIHVYYGSGTTVPGSVVVGADVTVSGQVNEVAQGTGGDFTLTEIDTPTAMVNSVNNALPAAVLIGAVNDPSMNERAAPLVNIGDNPTTGIFDPSTQGSDFWESLEGMRVTLLDTHAVGPYGAGGNLEVVPNLPNDPANNMFGGVTASNTTPGAPIAQSLFDFNPERVEVYTGRAADGTIISRPSAVNEGDHLGDITGVVSYYDEPEVLATSPLCDHHALDLGQGDHNHPVQPGPDHHRRLQRREPFPGGDALRRDRQHDAGQVRRPGAGDRPQPQRPDDPGAGGDPGQQRCDRRRDRRRRPDAGPADGRDREGGRPAVHGHRRAAGQRPGRRRPGRQHPRRLPLQRRGRAADGQQPDVDGGRIERAGLRLPHRRPARRERHGHERPLLQHPQVGAHRVVAHRLHGGPGRHLHHPGQPLDGQGRLRPALQHRPWGRRHDTLRQRPGPQRHPPRRRGHRPQHLRQQHPDRQQHHQRPRGRAR